MVTMALYIPAVGAFSILIFYTLFRRIYGFKAAFVSSILFAAASTHVIFTAGVTKETYGNPLYLTLLFLLLHPNLDSKSRLVSFTLVSVTLATVHHLTSILGLAIMFQIVLAFLIRNWVDLDLERSNRVKIFLPLIFMIILILYYGIYAGRGLKIKLNLND